MQRNASQLQVVFKKIILLLSNCSFAKTIAAAGMFEFLESPQVDLSAATLPRFTEGGTCQPHSKNTAFEPC